MTKKKIYDEHGFDQDGYDIDGYDINGFNKKGINPDIKVEFSLKDVKNNNDSQLQTAKNVLSKMMLSKNWELFLS